MCRQEGQCARNERFHEKAREEQAHFQEPVMKSPQTFKLSLGGSQKQDDANRNQVNTTRFPSQSSISFLCNPDPNPPSPRRPVSRDHIRPAAPPPQVLGTRDQVNRWPENPEPFMSLCKTTTPSWNPSSATTQSWNQSPTTTQSWTPSPATTQMKNSNFPYPQRSKLSPQLYENDIRHTANGSKRTSPQHFVDETRIPKRRAIAYRESSPRTASQSDIGLSATFQSNVAPVSQNPFLFPYPYNDEDLNGPNPQHQILENVQPDTSHTVLPISGSSSSILRGPREKIPFASRVLNTKGTEVGREERKTRPGPRPNGTYEIRWSDVDNIFYQSLGSPFTIETQHLYAALLVEASKRDPEGAVKGVGAKVERGRHFLYKIIECTNTVRCGQCRKVFRNETLLAVHTKKKHPSTLGVLSASNMSCLRCNETFGSIANLRRHTALAHNGTAEFICTLCSAIFSNRHPFVIHMRDKHDLMPRSRRQGANQEEHVIAYKCCACKTVTANRGNLIRHIKLIHLKLKLFDCEHCKGSFGTEHNLLCHKADVHMK